VHPNKVSQAEIAFHILDAAEDVGLVSCVSSCFRYRDFDTASERACYVCEGPSSYVSCSRLCATGERRQNFNLYGLGQLLLEIFLMGRASINQYRAHPDDSVEARIRPPLTGDPERVSDRFSLECFLGDACCGPCASPVMKGNGHHCVTLKHAFRPYRGGLKASTALNP
jgi:hypothetical protein